MANYEGGADWNGENGNVTTVGSATSESPWGAFDVAGNVMDMTETLGTPIPPNPPTQPDPLPTRIARGGDFWQAIQPPDKRPTDMPDEGGKIVLVGLGGQVDFPLDRAIVKGLTIIGSICGALTPARDLMAQRKIEIAPLITHEFPLDDINDAFEASTKPDEAVKVVLKP